jgi:hypothetical protein
LKYSTSLRRAAVQLQIERELEESTQSAKFCVVFFRSLSDAFKFLESGPICPERSHNRTAALAASFIIFFLSESALLCFILKKLSPKVAPAIIQQGKSCGFSEANVPACADASRNQKRLRRSGRRGK